MRCEICGNLFKKMETFLVCDQGHTIQNTKLVSHEDDFAASKAKTKSIRKAKVHRKRYIYKSGGCNFSKLIIIKKLLQEAEIYFRSENSFLFKNFTCFFKFRMNQLESDFDLNKNVFFALLYFLRRHEKEKHDEIYTFSDFTKEAKDFDFNSRLISLRNKTPSLKGAITELITTPTAILIVLLKKRSEEITNAYAHTKSFGRTKDHDTGVLDESVENAKFNIRSMIRNDLEISKKYFQYLCLKLDIEEDTQLNFYFEKFIYTFDPNTVFIPDYDFVFFLAAYFITIDKFFNSQLEVKVMSYLTINRHSFFKRLATFFTNINDSATPETLIESLSEKNAKNYIRLVDTMAIIDDLKKKTFD